jgi:type I restriction enzyme R subunit
MYPQFRGTFAEVITHSVERAQTLIDRFSAPESVPHIAISVDMLDTGIDVPEVVNLVFFKTVHSRTKFAQMIGRGTRLRPDLFGPGRNKTDFFVFDFGRNFEFFGHRPMGIEGNLIRSLSERVFRSGVQVLAELDRVPGVNDGPRADVAFPATAAQVRTELADVLHARVAGMNTENVIVRRQRREVELLAQRAAWATTDPASVEAMESVAGSPSTVQEPDEGAKRFDLLVLRMQLVLLTADPLIDLHRARTQELATRLLELTSIPAVAEEAAFLDEIASDDWWVDVTVPMLEQARRRIRGLVRLIPADRRRPVFSEFADAIGEGVEIAFPGLTVALDYERFKAKVFLAEHRDHVAIQRLHRNQPLTATDLAEFERILIQSGIGTPEHLYRARVENDGFGLFIRSLVGLDRTAAVDAMNFFVVERP